MEMDEGIRKLDCKGCGATLEYSAKSESLRCTYCGTVAQIPRLGDDVPVDAAAIIPLTVEPKTLTALVYEHLAAEDDASRIGAKLDTYTPIDLIEQATITKKEQFYVPAYIYHGKYVAQWTASFGYDRREEYTVYENRRDSRGNVQSVPVTKVKTVTDWRPVNGTDTGQFSVMAYAGAQLGEATVDATQLVEEMCVDSLVPFDYSYAAGIPMEPFATAVEDAYQARAESKVQQIVDESVRQHAQGDHQKDWHWTGNIEKETVNILAPICHVTYEFKGQPFHMWFDGTDPSRSLADERPTETINAKQESLIFSQLLAAVALIVVLPYLFLCSDRMNTFLYWCAVPVMLYGLWRGFVAWQYTKALRQYKLTIINNSHQIRQSHLAQMRAASGSDTTPEAMRDVTVNVPVLPKLFWNYDHFVFPAVAVILLLLGYFQFGSEQRVSPPQETASNLNYVSPPRPVRAPEPTAVPARTETATPVSGTSSATSDAPVSPAPPKREEPKPVPSAMKLPDQWKPLGSGSTRSLRVEGEHIYGKTTLREDDVRAGNSILMDVKKRGGKYTGETTLHLVSRSGQACTIRWPMELSTVTPERIEGRSMIPPGTATLDWNSCSYTLPSEWKSFTWVPVN
jgi:LSD1 subclass zinc finger protein